MSYAARVQPLVRAALATTALSVLAAAAALSRPDLVPRAPAAAASSGGLSALCPPGTLPDGDVCIPVPKPGTRALGQPKEAPAAATAEVIPRRPERERDYARYRWPVPWISGVASPDESRSEIALPEAPGTEVHVVDVEGQQGPALVVFAGELVGKTVITRHKTKDRTFLIVHGRMESVEASKGAEVGAGTRIGTAGDQFTIAVRQMRSGLDVTTLDGTALVGEANGVATDPRNVLRVGAR